MKNQWVLEKNFDYFHKNTKLAAKYKSPYQIITVFLHNNVEMKLSAWRKSIVHVNKLKPYNSKGQSGEINEGPDDPNLISLSDHPYLPTSIFGNQNFVKAQPLVNAAQPVQAVPRLEAQPAL